MCEQNPGHARECASPGNAFHDNGLSAGYGDTDVAAVAFFAGDNNYPGETGCDNHGQLRVRGWHNHPGVPS